MIPEDEITVEIKGTYLHGGGVDIKLPENGKGLLKQLIADGDVRDVRGIVVVQAVDVLHNAGPIGFNSRQDEQILEVSETQTNTGLNV